MKIKQYPLAKLEYDETLNVLYYRIVQNMEVDVPQTLEMIEYVKEFIGEQKHTAIVDFGGNLSSTTEARNAYANSNYIKTYRLADAFLVKSVAVRIVANFFIKATKPSVNTRLFSDEAEALKWLSKMEVLENA